VSLLLQVRDSLAVHGREGTLLLLDRDGNVWWCSWLTQTERERALAAAVVHAYGDRGNCGMFEDMGDGMLTQASGEIRCLLTAVRETGKRES